MKELAYIVLVLAILVAVGYFVKQNEMPVPETITVEEEITVSDEGNVEEAQDIIIDDDSQEEIEAIDVEETNPEETADEDETIISE